MIKRKKVSPIKFMLNHWTEILGLKGDVGCTFLVTRIAKNLGLLEDASITYIDVPRWLIDYDYFNHAHMLVPLQGSLATCSLDTVEMTPFQKALPSLAIQDLIKQDLPRCTILCMQVGTRWIFPYAPT